MKKMLFAINVGWYYDLHWKARVHSDMTDTFDVHLCMSKPNGHQEENMNPINLSRSSIGFYNNLRTFIQVISVVRKVEPDVIHSVTIKPNIMFGIISLIKKIPIFITIPGMGSTFSNESFKNNLMSKVILKTYKTIGKNDKSVFIFENKTDMNMFIDSGVCKNNQAVTVPGSGVNIDEYNALKVDTTPQPLKLLFAARLLEGKGLRELVRATQNLKQRGVDVELTVAGIIDDDSSEAIPLDVLESWNEQGKINWMGQINEGMKDVIASNDVIVLPTRYGEGLPRILIEANACRRPVITTNIGGCKDFVINGESGILIPVCDPTSLEEAIVKLSNRELCARLGEYGRQHVEDFYTDKHVIESYKNIYNR
ncbi:glycosyltransferase family 4 protein [Vibrio sp. 10N.247.311.14]|uniref:glycosyltransferase family 4 protein n=1 Tax=unclassified Vibrio TaxID=2614977 RepID=UPI0010BD8100|nr:glycosyltransferase family 4 protein [Vibrio sp. F13]TKF92871.1 glycosyltransferase family 4 protein [Vibrio sp. F13]TKG11654.1 glycosyltransferase family 4 protein [Vibrio sp. F13]